MPCGLEVLSRRRNAPATESKPNHKRALNFVVVLQIGEVDRGIKRLLGRGDPRVCGLGQRDGWERESQSKKPAMDWGRCIAWRAVGVHDRCSV